MSKRDDGGPAFPVESFDHEADMDTVKSGMSLRDWFAGQALAGFAHVPKPTNVDGVAIAAYAIADAMLAERNTPEES